MTPSHDEQTETDELNKILNEFRTNTDVNRDNYNMGGKDRFIEIRAETKAAIEAWSRQQTAQVLERLLKKYGSARSVSGLWFDAIAAADVKAELAALRVGLNRATLTPEEEA